MRAFGRIVTERHPDHEILRGVVPVEKRDLVDLMAVAVLESAHRRDPIWSTADDLSGVLSNVSETTFLRDPRHPHDPNDGRVVIGWRASAHTYRAPENAFSTRA
ncbi:MAG: hypothetical protein ABIP53_05295 [Candidatus Limnocylindrales bacterium]